MKTDMKLEILHIVTFVMYVPRHFRTDLIGKAYEKTWSFIDSIY